MGKSVMASPHKAAAEGMAAGIAGSAEAPAAIYDLDIWQAALLIVKRYGDDATQQAVNRVSDLLDAGDVKGAFIWYLVRNCIERLQARKRPSPESNDNQPNNGD
jgi:hypothetical protein